jgi:hypothetical protein
MPSWPQRAAVLFISDCDQADDDMQHGERVRRQAEDHDALPPKIPA